MIGAMAGATSVGAVVLSFYSTYKRKPINRAPS